MFDIDHYLNGIRIKEVEATEDLLRRTKQRCAAAEETRRGRTASGGWLEKAALIALPVAAALVAGIFIGARFFSPPAQPGAVAYYTVDINPSLCVNVGEDNLVAGVTGQNEDAQLLLGDLNCVGKPAGDAIRQIISAAQAAGYFSEGERYVLIGCFSADNTAAMGALGGLQAQLEADFGDLIDLLIVSGTLEDKQMADALSVSAGLLKLSQMAEGVKVTGGDKVEDIMDEVTETNRDNYCAPALSIGGDAQTLKFSWNALDFDAMGYTGKVKYHIATADTEAKIAEFTARTLKTVSFYTYGSQTTSAALKLSDCGIEPGKPKFYGIWAEYGGVMIASGAVAYTAPGATPTATPAPSETEPEPTATTAPSTGHTVSGRVSGDNVILSWDKDASGSLAGYKVVASKTNPNPSYPADGYLKYITNANTTSISLYEGFAGLQGDTYYYFSITWLYEDDSTVAGNAVRLKVPNKDDEPEPTDEPEESYGDYAASTISGGISGDTISLSWSGISDGRFAGYKVVASYTNPNPVYPSDTYLYYITNPGQTSASFDTGFLKSKLGAYSSGAVCHFSVTVLYDGGGVKIRGNAITLSLPEPEPEEPYASADINASLSSDGATVSFSWDAVSDPRFAYYKVVGSLTNPNPSYPDDGYLTAIGSASTTGWSISVSELVSELGGGSPGDTYYFTITVVYNTGVKMTGAVDTVTLP